MFLNPLGLLALLGLPIVLGLHLFRRRFRPFPVSAVFLWEARDHASIAGRKREPLRTNASFWLEMLAVLLLALGIAGLRMFGAGEARHLVVVLDASASMGAVHEEGSTREAAVEIVRERVAELPAGSRVTLITSGPQPAVLAGPAAFTAEALIELEDYTPTLGRHDLAPAVGLGQQLAGSGEVLLIGDRYEPQRWPEEVALVAVGRAADNLAITHAARRRERDGEGRTNSSVHLTLASFAREGREVEVTLSAAGEPLARRGLTLSAGARRHLSFELPAEAPVIEARLTPDALAIDDVAYLAPRPPRTVALASTLSREISRTLGLASGRGSSSIDRWLDLVPDCIDAGNPAAAHLVLSEGLVPGDAWVLALERSGEARTHLIGPFLTDKRHPLLDGVTLEGIVWTTSDEVALRGAPVVSAGDRPLLTEGRDGERVILRANLDAGVSSLHRSPDWPILLANLVEMRRRELPGPARTCLRAGEAFVYRGREPARYRLTGPLEGDAQALELRALGTLVLEGITRPGSYSLERLEEEGAPTPLCTAAVSFADAAESDLAHLSSGERGREVALAAVTADHSWIEVVLVVAALALLALDWWVLIGARRRFQRELEEAAR